MLGIRRHRVNLGPRPALLCWGEPLPGARGPQRPLSASAATGPPPGLAGSRLCDPALRPSPSPGTGAGTPSPTAPQPSPEARTELGSSGDSWQLRLVSRHSVLRWGSITGTHGSWSVARGCTVQTASFLKSRVRATLWPSPRFPAGTCGREGLAGGVQGLAPSPPSPPIPGPVPGAW